MANPLVGKGGEKVEGGGGGVMTAGLSWCREEVSPFWFPSGWSVVVFQPCMSIFQCLVHQC